MPNYGFARSWADTGLRAGSFLWNFVGWRPKRAACGGGLLDPLLAAVSSALMTVSSPRRKPREGLLWRGERLAIP